MKAPFLLLALAPVLAAAAPPGTVAETETFRWKDCPDAVRGLAINAFMEKVVAEDLVVYSFRPDKFAGVCPRVEAASIKQDLVEDEIARTEKENERRRAEARRAAVPDPRAATAGRFAFALGRLLDPDREIWLVHGLAALEDGDEDVVLERSANAVVTFEGTDKQGLLVDGQLVKGLLHPAGVVVTTNVVEHPAEEGEAPLVTREIHRLRRYEWVGEKRAEVREVPFEPAAPLPVYFQTHGINYLNAPTIFPLWLKATDGRFEVSRNFPRTCAKCQGKGRWIEWKKTVQTIVSCPACGGSGSVGVEKTYVILPDEPPPRKKSSAVSFE